MLTFESTAQLILQVRILWFMNYPECRSPDFMPTDNANAKYTLLEDGTFIDESNDNQVVSAITRRDIWVSIGFMVAHAVLELIFLILESYATKTSFINHCIVCFNGRYGWVPY